jgi:hypothetical protein
MSFKADVANAGVIFTLPLDSFNPECGTVNSGSEIAFGKAGEVEFNDVLI